MRKIIYLLIFISTFIIFPSCFKKEESNKECDILKASLHSLNQHRIFYSPTDSCINVSINSSEITFIVKRNTDLTQLIPEFKLVKGAFIKPKSGTIQDFSKGDIRYTVTSEDKKWHRVYKVKINSAGLMENDIIKYNFEHFELNPQNKKYYIWHNIQQDNKLGNDWATANEGISLIMQDTPANNYPTSPLDKGFTGHGISLKTISTGAIGKLVGKRIAAGNLFLGRFNSEYIFGNPLKTTEFGIRFNEKPIYITLKYQYFPGKNNLDKDDKPVNKQDSPNIYAIFYKNTDKDGKKVIINGANVGDNKNIIGRAVIDNIEAKQNWTDLRLDFKYNKDVNLDDLATNKYSFSIICTSSKNGNIFEGAEGSTLNIDCIEVHCTHEKQ